MQSMVPIEIIATKIYLIRGQKVMLDRDLAELYGVETKYLKRQVNRNRLRFPDDFMFELTKEELANWRRQFGTSNSEKMGLRYIPYAFSEQGIAMLSSILKSTQAILVNVAIIRAFVKLRQFLASHEDIKNILEEHDSKINSLIEAVNHLLEPQVESKQRIGFYKE